MEITTTKICVKCKEKKSLKDFYLLKTGRYYSYCQECKSKHHQEWCLKNYEKDKLRKSVYHQNHLKKEQEQHRQWIINNKQHIKEYSKQYSQNHRHQRNNYNQKQALINPIYKITKNLRGRIRHAIKSQFTIKSLKTIQLLGCSFEELKNYLESKFQLNMTWDNYGGGDYSRLHWHVDHIKPCASFDLTKPEEQQKCFHYTNLQPLWAKDNISKSNKLEWSKT